MRTRRLQAPGAARALAALVSHADPDVIALNDVDAGDALATATRFDRQWAYRGGQALLWNSRIAARGVHDLYVPASPLRAFDRRGLLRVDGACDGSDLHLFATQFAGDRSSVRDLRFARSAVRAVSANVLLFIAEPPQSRISFADLGVGELRPLDDVAIYARGYRLRLMQAGAVDDALGSAAIVRAETTA